MEDSTRSDYLRGKPGPAGEPGPETPHWPSGPRSEPPGGPGEPELPLGDAPVDVSHIRRRLLDVPYAPLSPAQELDIYLPETGDGPYPVIFYVHGGGFEIGDKRGFGVLPWLNGLNRGYAVVSVNYRLSGETIFPAGPRDVKAALRWVRAHGRDHGLDPGRVVVTGESAGGNLAALMCVSAGVEFLDDPALGNVGYGSEVQACVDWFGPLDMVAMDRFFIESGRELLQADKHGDKKTSPEARYLGARVAEVPERAALANPMTYVGKTMAPILIQHGGADHLVPVQQSVEFARVIEERVGPDRFEFDILEGADHVDPMFATSENMARVFDFMDKHLR